MMCGEHLTPLDIAMAEGVVPVIIVLAATKFLIGPPVL
jgi:hypothetical protein